MKTVITSSLGDGSATIKELAWQCPDIQFGSGAVEIPLMRAPKYAKGTLKVCIRTSGGHIYRWLGEIDLAGESLTTKQYDYYMKGSFGSVAIQLIASDDSNFPKIVFSCNSEVGDVTYYTNIHFEGMTVWKKGTTNQEASVV